MLKNNWLINKSDEKNFPVISLTYYIFTKFSEKMYCIFPAYPEQVETVG